MTMKTSKIEAEIAEGKEINLKDIALSNANSTLQRMELAGLPETKVKTWPFNKAGYIAGYVTGLHFGFHFAKKLAALPVKETPKEGEQGFQPELPL